MSTCVDIRDCDIGDTLWFVREAHTGIVAGELIEVMEHYIYPATIASITMMFQGWRDFGDDTPVCDYDVEFMGSPKRITFDDGYDEDSTNPVCFTTLDEAKAHAEQCYAAQVIRIEAALEGCRSAMNYLRAKAGTFVLETSLSVGHGTYRNYPDVVDAANREAGA